MNDLKDLKVADIIRSEAFAKELRQQLDIEEATQTKMIASGLKRRTTLDRLRERGVWNERDMAVLWPRVMDKTLGGYSAAERKAIDAVCMAAYKRTMRKAVAEEKSELTRRDIIKFLENCRDTTESAEVARNCSKWVGWLEEKAVSEWNDGFDRTLEQIAQCIDYAEYHAEGLIENYDPLYGFLKYVKKKLS